MGKLIEDTCLEIIDEVYDRGYSMNKEQVDELYDEVASWFLLKLYESA